MEVLLLTIFFIAVLILFIAGKDDFGRTENKITSKKMEKNKKEELIEPTENKIISKKMEKSKKEEVIQPSQEIKKE